MCHTLNIRSLCMGNAHTLRVAVVFNDFRRLNSRELVLYQREKKLLFTKKFHQILNRCRCCNVEQLLTFPMCCVTVSFYRSYIFTYSTWRMLYTSSQSHCGGPLVARHFNYQNYWDCSSRYHLENRSADRNFDRFERHSKQIQVSLICIILS